jgi:hypothetical protein
MKITIIHHAHFSWKKKQHLPTNFESDYTTLKNSVNNNINEHAIISNLPLKTYLDYKKFISNALTMDNYKINNTAQEGQLFNS